MPTGDKKAADVARQIESEIMRRGWPVGELLGSEPDLIARFGVSRAVFREAVRIVEHDGAARMRRGPGGGLVVSPPELVTVEDAATLYLDYANVTAQDLYDVRSSLELTCTSLVTESLTEEKIARLREVLAQERRGNADSVETGRSHDLHVVLAEVSGNRAMRLFVETLTRLTFERVGHWKFDDEQLRQVHAAHEAIVDAIIAGDAALAQHRMRRHLAAGIAYYYRREAEDAGAPKARAQIRTRNGNPRRRGAGPS